MAAIENHVKIELVTDPDEIASFRRRTEQFNRNMDWLQAHAAEVYRHRGRIVCIAGQELFVGDDVLEVVARARTAHPNDEGWFTRIIPEKRGPRIYAC